MMTKQQQRALETVRKHAQAGNTASAARQLSAMIRAARPVAVRAELLNEGIKLGLHTHHDFVYSL
jgi:hypothetical protein